MSFNAQATRTLRLEWVGSIPGAEIEAAVREDIARSLQGMPKPSSLITHTVFLSHDFDGPSVSVWGEEGCDDALWCQYREKTEWTDAASAGLR